jgi:hypothetical protein
LDRGETRATSWFEKARLVAFSPEDVLTADPRGGSFANVNTPEELARMEQRILDGEMRMLTDENARCAPPLQKVYSCGYQRP